MNSSPPSNRAKFPPLKALLAFEAASRHGSFAQGASELAVTPSAVSHQIQQLEEFLGVQLFQRHAGRVILTSAGRTYAREIKVAFSLISEATNFVAPQSQEGHLVIAAGPSFAAKWLQPRLADFFRTHPDIQVRISTLSGHEDLETDRFDIAIPYWSPRTSQQAVEPLVKERVRPLCSPALARELDLHTPADLARATLIHSSNALTWTEYLRKVDVAGLRPTNELWLDRSMMAVEAAVNGLGVVLESELLAEQEIKDGRLVAVFGDDEYSVETTTYYFLRSPGFKNAGKISAFEQWLRSAIQAAHLTART